MNSMSTSALDAAPVVDAKLRVPGGGGPGDLEPGDRWEGGGGPRGSESVYRLAAWLTVAWVSSLFAALAMAYWLRSKNVFLWRPIDVPAALWLSTVVLGLSSLMLELSRRALGEKRWFVYRRRLLLTIYLALGFAACQGAAMFDLMRHGFYLRADPHSSAFYVFTAAHALHLAGGVVALNYLLLERGRKYGRHRELLGAIAIYWHFMGIVWAGLFALLHAW